MTATPQVTLISSDDVSITVGMISLFTKHGLQQYNQIADHSRTDRAVAERSTLIKNMLDDFGTVGTVEEAIPIPSVRLLRPLDLPSQVIAPY